MISEKLSLYGALDFTHLDDTNICKSCHSRKTRNIICLHFNIFANIHWIILEYYSSCFLYSKRLSKMEIAKSIRSVATIYYNVSFKLACFFCLTKKLLTSANIKRYRASYRGSVSFYVDSLTCSLEYQMLIEYP